jgi:2-succinyl-6-hydroxy-2,4-cyclohexadiene-1-carboxylate synthase
MPDLPGHGDNATLSLAQPLNFDLIVEDLRLFFEYLGLDQVILIGYSMGGRIALYAAATYPAKIRALILEGASPGLEAESARQERARLDDERAEFLQAKGVEAFVDQWYNMPLFQTLQARPHLLATVKQKRTNNNPRWLAKIISELSPGRQPSLWPRLTTLSMPVLLLAGELDSTYASLVTKMSRQIPGAIIRIIPQAGHNIHLEQPIQFIESVQAFLQAVT